MVIGTGGELGGLVQQLAAADDPVVVLELVGRARRLERVGAALGDMPAAPAALADGALAVEQCDALAAAAQVPAFAAHEEELVRRAAGRSAGCTRRAVSRFVAEHADEERVPEAERPSTLVLRRRGDRFVLHGDLSLADGTMCELELSRVKAASRRRAEEAGAGAAGGRAAEPSAVPREERWSRRLGAALPDVVRRSITLGQRGAGSRPELVVWAHLRPGDPELHEPTLEDGTALSRAAFERICADADLRRLLVSPAGEPLELGRSVRCGPQGLRRFLAARDRGCVAPGCDEPPGGCRIHHRRWWERGGRTDPDACELRCERCHERAHAIRLTISQLEQGRAGLAVFTPDGRVANPEMVDAAHLRRLRRIAGDP